MVESRLSIVFFTVGILDRSLAGLGENLADFPLGCRRFDLGAGEVEVPLVAVVEKEQHALPFFEHVFDMPCDGWVLWRSRRHRRC